MHRSVVVSFCLVVALAAAGCSSGETVNARPQGSPDIAFLTVSGHVGVLTPTNCTSADNRAYLGDLGGAGEGIWLTFANLGYSLADAHYADIFDGVDADDDGITDDPDARGFRQLVVLLQNIYDEWMAGFENPTRIVIVAHGHGAVWAHMAASVMSHIPIEYLITLDGTCELWECEYQAEVADWLAANGDPYPWDISHPCGLWPIAGQPNDYDTSDVAFDNVRYNLEVQSDDPGAAGDEIDNYRLDGSRRDIRTFFSANEDRNDILLITSNAVIWLDQRIRTVELTGDF